MSGMNAVPEIELKYVQSSGAKLSAALDQVLVDWGWV